MVSWTRKNRNAKMACASWTARKVTEKKSFKIGEYDVECGISSNPIKSENGSVEVDVVQACEVKKNGQHVGNFDIDYKLKASGV